MAPVLVILCRHHDISMMTLHGRCTIILLILQHGRWSYKTLLLGPKCFRYRTAGIDGLRVDIGSLPVNNSSRFFNS